MWLDQPYFSRIIKSRLLYLVSLEVITSRQKAPIESLERFLGGLGSQETNIPIPGYISLQLNYFLFAGR